jgi:hypothetical protein
MYYFQSVHFITALDTGNKTLTTLKHFLDVFFVHPIAPASNENVPVSSEGETGIIRVTLAS